MGGVVGGGRCLWVGELELEREGEKEREREKEKDREEEGEEKGDEEGGTVGEGKGVMLRRAPCMLREGGGCTCDDFSSDLKDLAAGGLASYAVVEGDGVTSFMDALDGFDSSVAMLAACESGMRGVWEAASRLIPAGGALSSGKIGDPSEEGGLSASASNLFKMEVWGEGGEGEEGAGGRVRRARKRVDEAKAGVERAASMCPWACKVRGFQGHNLALPVAYVAPGDAGRFATGAWRERGGIASRLARRGHGAGVRAMIDAGYASLDDECGDGQTLLMLCLERGFLPGGGDALIGLEKVARTDILGQGVLHKAVLGGVLVAGNNTMPGGIGGEDDDMSLNKGRGGGLRGIAKGIIEPLLRCGICVDGKDAHGLSPLALAADYGVTGLISGTCSFHEKAMRFIALAVICPSFGRRSTVHYLSIIQSTHPSIHLSKQSCPKQSIIHNRTIQPPVTISSTA